MKQKPSIRNDPAIQMAWVSNPTIRSESVITWCEENGIETTLSANQLAAAMAKMPYWNQGASNYLDFVIAFEAAINV